MPPPVTSESQAPDAAPRCPLGREYRHFAGPHLQNPYPFFARLRKEEPVTFSPELSMWMISRQDDITAVLSNPAVFSSAGAFSSGDNLTAEARAILGPGPIIHDSPLNTDPPVHTRLRRFLQQGFLPARVARQEPRIRQFANALIDGFLHEGRADLVERFTYPLPVQVILGMLGVPAEDMPQVKQWSSDLFGLIFGQAPVEAQPALARSVVEYRAYCTRLIEQRRRQPQEDLTSELVHTQFDGDTLKTPELVSLVGGSLLAAGHESTTAQLGLMLKNLLEQPERWELLRKDRTLIPKAIEECLRLESVVAGMIRTTTREVELGGMLIPKGERLLLLFGSANHDEAYHPGAERFELQRGNPQHLTFGKGIHFCMGASLARMELRVALELLLERIPELRLVPGKDYGYQQNLVTMRAIRHLHAQWPVR